MSIPHYTYIRAFGIFSGSTQDYINRQITLAIQTQAPCDAVYFSGVKMQWVTLEELNPSSHARLSMELIIQQNGWAK